MIRWRAVVIGASAGGAAALVQVLRPLPADYPLPLIVVQHLHPWQQGAALLSKSYAGQLALKLCEAEEKQPPLPGVVYFAPANYHLLIESDGAFALSTDEKVNFTRPAIDVLFESAAETYGPALIGIILTGANQDGAAGLQAIQQRRGLTIIQDPASAEVDYMPRAALSRVQPDYLLPLDKIGACLCRLVQ